MERAKKLWLGCVADDFTGAGDAASVLREAGVSTVLFNGVPEQEWERIPGGSAVVIALKTRTEEKERAVGESLAAFRWLKDRGAALLYNKYCSTFDSTPEGNIGPVLDAVLKEWGLPFTLLCPSLLVNGREVRDGKLYVNGELLENSPMRSHPLNPMKKSALKELMEEQSEFKAYPVPAGRLERFAEDKGSLEAYVRELGEREGHFYLIPDYYRAEHGELLAGLFGELAVLSGGSGLLEPLAAGALKGGRALWSGEEEGGGAEGPAVLLAGSCSAATLEQIRDFQERGGLSLRLRPEALLNGEQSIGDIRGFLEEHPGEDALIYSSAPPEEVKKSRKLCGRESSRLSGLLEETAAQTAAEAVKLGRRRIISAGGETSGAVARRLGFSGFHIGRSVAPGVPVMIPFGRPDMRVVLKSGNFGRRDFFTEALKKTAPASPAPGRKSN